MSTHTKTYHVCDGCGKDEDNPSLYDLKEIAKNWHLCSDCRYAGYKYCYHCRCVHKDKEH